MKRVKEYKVVSSTKDENDLIESVNVLISKEWMPLGGISAVSYLNPARNKEQVILYQAVVKYED